MKANLNHQLNDPDTKGVEILSIGTELLLGNIVNTNSKSKISPFFFSNQSYENFRQTGMASLSPTDLELVVVNYIRNHYEKKHKQNVPMALKYLTIQFSNKIIGCTLLTIKQDLQFFKLLCTKIPSIRRFNLLFRAADHNYSCKKFHEYCDDKGGTITIIKSNFGNIFGGYTSKSWTSKGGYTKDEKAFLFLIKSDDKAIQSKCPLLLELKKEYVNYAICSDSTFGPTFGRDDIFIHSDCNNWIATAKNCAYKNSDNPQINICGGNISAHWGEGHFCTVNEYQVFQIK